MSKQAKRKITVNISPKTKTLPKSRPSVFERLGTKAGSAHKEVCHHWAQHGTCPYGKGCKYSSTHTLISPSKQRLAKKENESKKRHSKEGTHKRLHSSNLKSAQSPEEEWNQWDPTELEDADPDDLEKRRQELQRQLELQMKMENKARKKEKKLKRESSPSTESSSSSSDSSTSSDESSSTSSSSVETTRRKKTKKVKVKQRESSSSSDRDRARKHKSKNVKHSTVIVKSVTRTTDKSKKLSPAKPVIKITTKSPTPVRTSKKSQTPPPKLKTFIPIKKDSSRSKSPRPASSTSDHKEKHRTPSPKIAKEKEKEKEREKEKPTRDRDRDKEKERERERERDKEKEREREKEKEREREREKEKEREREREKEREREREKAREREKEREKEKEQKKRDTRSPRRDSKLPKDSKRKESPESRHSRDRKLSPSRSRGSGSGSSRRDNSRKSSPAACKDDRRADKRDDHDRSRGKDRVGDKGRKDKRDSRDRDRDRDRERRIAREERDAAREKEREEALARCQERQRERERLKELAKKEEERRNRDRGGRREDRGLDKPSGDRVERLLPLPADRIPPSRRGRSPEKERTDRDRTRDSHRERTPDRSRSGARKSVDRHERLERDVDRIEHVDRDRSERIYDRNYERSERSYDRDPERDRDRERDYPSLSSRLRDSERRHDDKSYDSPYERGRHEDRRYLELEDRYNESSRDDRMSIDARDYPDDRRSHREMWDVREDRDVERDREIDQRRYGREDSRPPSLKGRDWDAVDYPDHEWDRGRRPLDWEGRGAWDNRDHEHSQLDDEWRHYNRSMDSWTADERRRWPEWRDRSRPRSATSHRDEEVGDVHKRELPKQDSNDSSQQELEPKKESVLGKRAAEQPLEGVVDAKKPCIKEPPLEDDLSEISDDADEILNREEELPETQIEENLSADSAIKSSEKEIQETQPPPASASSQKSQSPNRTPNRITKDESMDDENMDLDFEEISEDELEEETRVKGLGDALGVDWASLVAESRPRVKPVCSAKRRWESHNILINLGISVEMAGEDLVKDILLEHTQAKLKEEKEETAKNVALKQQIVKKSEENSNESTCEVKQEPVDILTGGNTESPTDIQVKENEEKIKIESNALELKQEIPEIQISHPVAAIQVALREKEAIRKSLFASAGPYRRALSARRDLAIRRHLCNLPIKDTYVEAPKRHDPELLKQALQLFERSL